MRLTRWYHEIWRPVLIGQPLTLFLTQMKLSVLFLTSQKDFHLNKHQRYIFTAVPIITSLDNGTHSSNKDECLIDVLFHRQAMSGSDSGAVV